MDLTLILGPMKSGKSFELISYFAPLKFTDIPHIIIQPNMNVRDKQIWSRNGVTLEAHKMKMLKEKPLDKYAVVGIDEVHMFVEEDAFLVGDLLKKGVKVVASGLEIDYRGEMFPIIRRLLSLGPREVKYKRAVCENCKSPDAIHTQIFHHGKPVTGGLPYLVPEDGTYEYKAVCRHCFVHA